ncbi:conserved hypothetical protein [Histoplasma capsulatum G186AR]|uniref:Chromatin assembly factor 1 subunit A n=2 Tax=Ajellomyces capsulatus TaxID=5037 RepID=C0NTQ7_AJECG|nr:uncharacterized protein HCBG_06537 [Histoplasma capsulatum G186AR]EEH05418.1 conserved hypothetical protein [Histoplasma capsulatum G186AR]KAG5305210.1 chromatin assembly factor 1 subunit A [Histoplasma capsulatum]QSS76170.1 chromatin assembly factor 1 subunit A [Histoplasma capsulatum G186AR]
MGSEPLPGSMSSPASSRKRSFSDVDGCVQTANSQDQGGMVAPEAVVQNDDFKGPTITNTPKMESEILPSIESAGVPQPIVTTKTLSTSTSTSSTSVDPPLPHADGNGSSDPSISTPIPAPNHIDHVHTQNQTPPPSLAASVSTPGFTLPNNSKKRKLSPTSKQVRALEKEMKEKQRAEEKAKKDEERRKREEERKKREEEKKKRDEEREEERRKREEKKKVKDEERLAREEEKKRRDEERMKKERSQMRLNAFFAKPTTSNSTSAVNVAGGMTGGNSNSVCSSDSGSETLKAETKPSSDYEQEFPLFFLQSHVKLAPPHRFERDINALKYVCEKLDSLFKKEETSEAQAPPEKLCPSELFDVLPYRRRQGKATGPTVREILLGMQGVGSNTINLTGDKKTQTPGDFLKKIPMKVLKFGEDVRPPYQGTFTKRLPERDAKRLCRNPFRRMVPDFNYDYDSEAEWEEPEEGEDLDSEGEDEISEDGDGDMEDFLDDGDDDTAGGKRRVIIGDLEPVSSGIHWEGEDDVDPMLSSCRMEIISETLNFPIDPFSSEYWSKPIQTSRSPLKHLTHLSNRSSDRAGAIASPSQKQISPSSGLLQPSFTLPSTTLTTTISSGHSKLLPAAAPSQKPRRAFPPDQVAEFKQAIAGSNLTKAGLIEVLKKRFPKVSKDIIKDTLNSTAQRLGQKEADKKWVLI